MLTLLMVIPEFPVMRRRLTWVLLASKLLSISWYDGGDVSCTLWNVTGGVVFPVFTI